MKTARILLALGIGTLPLIGGWSWTSARGDEIQFNRDIRPILSDRCFQCHGPDDKKREAGLRLDLEETAKQDLGGYRAIVDRQPEESELVARILSTDPYEQMPPPESGKKLSAAEKQLLADWIQQGAPFEQHWAFQIPQSPPLPHIRDTRWPRNEIDHFILARLERENLQPAAEADRRTLLRRLAIDLTGLLPTPEEVERFVNDPDPNAYEKQVDRLLQSQHFGERMGRHWLDLARYADSNGYANDGLRSIWPYRDWVIQAINDDMPFDQFTIEQLAGDLLPDATESQKIATGFHRNTPHQTEGGSDPEQYRVERVKNRTDTTGAVWLGLTVGCAQCHSHKFDPISHEDYYQLYAFFNNADEPTLTLQPAPEDAQRIAKLESEIRQVREALQREQSRSSQRTEREQDVDWTRVRFESLVSVGGATLRQDEQQSVLASGKNPNRDTYQLSFQSDDPVKSIRLETLIDPSLPQQGPGRAGNGNFVLAEITVEQNEQPIPIVAAIADHAQSGYPVTAAFDRDPRTGWAINVTQGKLNVDRQAIFSLKEPVTGPIRLTLTSYEQGSGYNIGKFRISTSATTPAALDSREKELDTLLKNRTAELQALKRQVPTTLVIGERNQPRDSFVQLRGDFLDPGKPVTPRTLSVLPPLRAEQPNRLDLARWLVSAENPLTSRVVVNRAWQRLFGMGLVETENDFGYQGSLPSHPQLLDYLAVDLVQNGWQMKRLYKQMVMSATYRQSSRYRPDVAEIDPKNSLLARQNRYRVEAEIIRDLALSASGLLSRKVGGTSVFPPIPPNVIGTSSANHRWPESSGDDRYRRGLYTAVYRANVYPMLSVFDGPDRDNPCTRRSISNTPLQALTVANDATLVEAAVALGNKLAATSDLPENPVDRPELEIASLAPGIDLGYEIAFSRQPTPAERQRLGLYFQNVYRYYQSDPEAAQELVAEQDPHRAAWTCVARVLLNLDEFITRE